MTLASQRSGASLSAVPRGTAGSLRAAAVLLVTAAAAILAQAPARTGTVYDGFEGDALAPCWETIRFVPGAVRMQSSVVRAGRGAAQITLRPGDQIPREKGSELERAELQEARRLWSVEDSTYTYSFSLFLPRDFPVVPSRLVIAQWKQHCPADTCTPGNPVLAVRYEGGELLVTRFAAGQRDVLYRTREDIRNRWLDFTFEIRFSSGQHGRIKARLGDTVVVDYTGMTAYPESGGYTRPAAFYFKFGLYRDRCAQPMTIFLDEYRKERTPDSVP